MPTVATFLWRTLVVIGVVVVCLVSAPSLASAESAARQAQLSNMLKHADFRVRTQAAFSLGRVGDRAAVPQLVKTLADRHPAVRAAAAVALGRLADTSALPALRRHEDSSEAVNSQIRRAISSIEESTGAAEAPVQLSWSKARHYVELADVINTSKTKRPGLDKLIKTLAVREIRRLPQTVAGNGSSRPDGLDAKLRRHRVLGYRVSAALGRLVRYMGPDSVQIRAEVMLTVTSYPGHTYCMTINASEGVSQPRKSFRSSKIPSLQEDALSGALGQAFSRLKGALTSGKARKCHGKAGKRRRR